MSLRALAMPRSRFRLLPPDLPFAWWLPYSWLVYFALFFIFAAFGNHRPASWWLNGVVTVAFLALYFRAFWLEGRRLVPIVAGMVALGVLMIPHNAGASVFFVYAAACVGDTGRPAVAFRWLMAVLAVLAIETLILQLPLQAWLPGILFGLLVGGSNIHFSERNRAAARLRLAEQEVEHLAKVAERERIARDLHDLLGHTLSVIVLKSELAAKLAERDPSRAVTEIRDVERISREALTEVRRAVHGYHDLTLEESLARARQALGAAGVELEADVTGRPADPRTEGVVSAVVREAVTNIIRHAHAARCWLRLAEIDGCLRLEIRDDGVGGRSASGTGLSSMRSRVEELGGRFEHESGQGTRLRIDLPLADGSGTSPGGATA
jgi:two-component system sensor histidine kinase DesK